MTCFKCEVTRAKIVATTMAAVGKRPHDIVHLLNKGRSAYFIEHEQIGNWSSGKWRIVRNGQQSHMPPVVILDWRM